MDRTSAGISDKYARSDKDYNQPDDHPGYSRRGRYRDATVRQWHNPPRNTPRRNGFYRSSGAYTSQYLQSRSVHPAQDFNALIKQEIMDGLLSRSGRFGHRYDGRNHGLYANSIKQYTSAAKRPLNQAEQSQLIHFLEKFTAARSWNWRSLTTTLHAFTSAGVFTPHSPMGERIKHTQAVLLSTLLDAIIFNCNQRHEDSDIDARGIANLLWALAKLVDNGQEQTPWLKEAVTALLPHVNAQQSNFTPQGIANLMWALAKLVDNGQEQTSGLKEAVAALLPHVNAQKSHFKPQGITNLLWALAKLVDNGQKQTPDLKDSVAALLPLVHEQKDQVNARHIVNLLWAMAKLVDNGQERTPGLNMAVAALLPLVHEQKSQLNNQGITNLLWAIAKLVDNGQERTPGLNMAVATLLQQVNAQKVQFRARDIASLLWAVAKLLENGHEQTPGLEKAVAALLPHVNASKDQFIPQQIANLLWAMAKLVDNGQEQKPGLKKAVAALLPHVNAQADQFNAQGIANLLWAMAKLVDNGREQTPGLKKAVAALLPRVNAQKDQFNAQDITNLVWAIAKLLDNGQEQASGLNEAMATLLPLVKVLRDQFIPQHIANLLWAMAKLGELVELHVVTSTFESLLYRFSDNPQLFQQDDIVMSLWGVMVCCARLSLAPNAIKNSVLEKQMDDLSTRLENTSPDNQKNQQIITMAAIWLGRACPIIPHYRTTISKPQADLRNQLQSRMPSLKIEQEKSLNSLPPVDLLLPDHNMVIEIQGPSHYVSNDFKIRNGSTLLKIALLQKSGFEVIEIPVNQLWSQNSIKLCIDQIKARVDIPPQGHGCVSLDIGSVEGTNVTADKKWQSSNHCYLAAEENSEKQTGKPKKRKRNRKKKPITASPSS
ncbi:RAP domain-containing protein [Salinisphaera sp. G21_0]|uniref:RAP domain-containing protein n=1 Tax=Salinisphaera sp. G21_0 TaxID=2821094 RepID=UPI001ADACC72|nr:RAP domain-containing protein [Salinisphaera sp. G21_0]MBO9483814.1 DUF1601 domain-containing protein [Salinisphaera sp. G21_0]